MEYIPASYIAIFSISLSAVAVILVISLEYWSRSYARSSNQCILIDEKDTLLGDIHYKEWHIKNTGEHSIKITRLNLLVGGSMISLDELHLIRSVYSFDLDIAFIPGNVQKKTIIQPGEECTLMAVQFKAVINTKKFTDIFSTFDWAYAYRI